MGEDFIASHITDKLVELEHYVVDNLSRGKKEYINKSLRFYKCDITNYDTLKLVFDIEELDVFIHYAAES